jgi:hypothetical protein
MRNPSPSWDRAVFDARELCAAVRRRECRAYQFADGFDNYNTASLMYEYTFGTNAISSSYARFAPPSGLPGQGIRFNQNGALIRKNTQSNQATFIIKLAVNFQNLGAATSGNGFLLASDAGTAQWFLTVSTSGALGIWSNGSYRYLTGPGIIGTNLWYGIEVEVTVSSTAGVVNVWVNGTQVMAVTGICTQASANAYANQVAIGDAFTEGVNLYADDFRVWDNTGSTQSAPLGTDSRIVTKMPSGAGQFTQWTPNGAAANWQCVDDNPPDDDTTYVSGATASLLDAYAMPSAGFTLAPAMVVARSRVRKDDGATRQLQLGAGSSGSTGVTETYTLGSTYAFVDACVPDDPHTSVPWTAAAADAAQHFKAELT